MNNEFQSEYYNSFEATMERYNVPLEAYPFAGEEFQGTEEMFFGFIMFLIS